MPRGRRLLLLLGMLLGTLLGNTPRAALAKLPQTPGSALAQQGAAALLSGDLRTAEQALTAAYRQTPSAELLFQLGQLAAAQAQTLLAQDLMRRYLNDPATEPANAAAAQKVLQLPRPPSGKIRVQGDRGGLVLLDGRLLGRLPLVQPLLAAPGLRSVAIQYPGKRLDVQVEVVTGRMVDIQCTQATGALFVATPPALLLLPELTEISPATSELLLDAVERAAQGQQLTLLKPEALLTLIPELKSLPEPRAQAELKQCLSQAACLQRLLRQSKLDHALRIRARAAGAGPENNPPEQPESPVKQWEFSTELLHVSILGVASQNAQSCGACTETRAAAALQAVVSHTLASGLTRSYGTLTVSSEPAGAQVWLAARRLGETPLSLQIWPGEYTLELRQPGHTPEQRAVVVESAKTAEVTAHLLPVATPPVPVTTPPAIVAPPVAPPPRPLYWQRAQRPRWRLIVGVTSVLVGLSFTTLGAIALAHLPAGPCPPMFDPRDPPPNCDFVGNTEQHNLGLGFTVAGSTLVLSGVGLIAWPGPRQLVRY